MKTTIFKKSSSSKMPSSIELEHQAVSWIQWNLLIKMASLSTAITSKICFKKSWTKDQIHSKKILWLRIHQGSNRLQHKETEIYWLICKESTNKNRTVQIINRMKMFHQDQGHRDEQLGIGHPQENRQNLKVVVRDHLFSHQDQFWKVIVKSHQQRPQTEARLNR